jgi:competence protein ComEC
VRGTIMASLFLLAEALGRQRSGMVALTLAAAVMAGISPYILGDASFQLSFLAMAGLIFIFPVFSNLGRRLVTAKLGEDGAIVALANVTVDTMSATLGAIIAVWPVVAYYFGIFSLAGPLATFLAMPVLPVIIITGTFAAVVGLASVAVAQVLGWIAWPFLTYMILVVKGLAAPSIASLEVGNISPVFLIGYYAVLAAAIFVNGRWQKLRNLASGAAGVMKAGVNVTFGLKRSMKWLIIPLAIIAAMVSFTAAAMPDDDLHVSFLDVGEGDAILVQKGNKQILIDGGPSPQEITLQLSKHMAFWDRTIDLVILTHPHQDHLGGLVEVLKRYRVGAVLCPDMDYESPFYNEFLKCLSEKEIKSTTAIAGHQVNMADGVVIKVLNPPENPLTDTESDIDNGSMVLLLEDGEVSFLLAGDIMRDTEREFIRERAEIAGTILKVAHHGSDTSSIAEFLAVVNPQIAVISCGADNKFGFPKEEVIKRLGEKVGKENILRTDIDGTIDFITDGKGMWMEMEK